MFNINFTYLINLFLPPVLRQEKNIAWLQVCLSYVEIIYNNYIKYKIDKLYEINFTGQTMYLEKKLQDAFEDTGIYISDGVILDIVYLYHSDEGKAPTYIYNKSEAVDLFLYNESEVIAENAFIVYIPLSLYITLTENDFALINSIVNYYKLADKTFKIQSYE